MTENLKDQRSKPAKFFCSIKKVNKINACNWEMQECNGFIRTILKSIILKKSRDVT